MTWECVQLEIERQEGYCREHRITRYHHHNEENPLSSRITCSICGSTFMQLRPKKEEEKDQAFIRAWNFLVSHGLRYAASFREMAREGENELVRYRAREMAGVLGDRGRIREFDYGLCNKVLDHVEVTDVGRLAVIFLPGTRVTV